MSDHNKMLIDRIKGMPAQPGDLSEEIGWLLQEIDEQKDELDRLRAEVSEWKMKYESEVTLVDNVEAELDRLRAEVARLRADQKRADIITISKKRYVALMAAAMALKDFWGYTQGRGGEYHVVARQTMDALDALRAARVEMGKANASAAAAVDPE